MLVYAMLLSGIAWNANEHMKYLILTCGKRYEGMIDHHSYIQNTALVSQRSWLGIPFRPELQA